jgi:hypothetical protein
MKEVRTSSGVVRTPLKYHICNETDRLKFYKVGQNYQKNFNKTFPGLFCLDNPEKL